MSDTLEDCNRLYEIQVRRLLAEAEWLPAAEAISRIQWIARFASAYGPGILADPRLDAILTKIAAKEINPASLQRSPKDKRRILHVITEVYSVGGHARVVNGWIQLDRASEHVIVLTKQKARFPDWLETALRNAHVSVHFVPSQLRSLDRARWLRKFAANQEWTTIVLHHHGFDATVVLAFADDGEVPIVVYNHADHVFWLGASVADILIDFSPKRIEFSKAFRQARQQYLLPLPLSEVRALPSSQEMRRDLGLTSGAVMLVTIARSFKLEPVGEHNFFSTLGKVLAECPEAHLFVIGVSEDQYARFSDDRIPPNLHVLGEVDDPGNYCAAADIFLEPFPLGAGLGMLDVCRFGAAPVFAFGHLPTIYGELAIDLLRGSGADLRLQTESEYRAYLVNLIRNPKKIQELGGLAKDFINGRCTGHGWLDQLNGLYALVERSVHRVAEVSEPRWGNDRHFRYFHLFTCRDFLRPLLHFMSMNSSARTFRELVFINRCFLRSAWKQSSFRGIGVRKLLRFNAMTFRLGTTWLSKFPR